MGSVWVWIVGAVLVLALFALLRPRKAQTPRRVLQARRRGNSPNDTAAWIATGVIGAGAAHSAHASDRNDRDGAPGGHFPGDGHEHGHSDSGSSLGDTGGSSGDSGGGGGDGGGGGGGGGGD